MSLVQILVSSNNETISVSNSLRGDFVLENVYLEFDNDHSTQSLAYISSDWFGRSVTTNVGQQAVAIPIDNEAGNRQSNITLNAAFPETDMPASFNIRLVGDDGQPLEHLTKCLLTFRVFRERLRGGATGYDLGTLF